MSEFRKFVSHPHIDIHHFHHHEEHHHHKIEEKKFELSHHALEARSRWYRGVGSQNSLKPFDNRNQCLNICRPTTPASEQAFVNSKEAQFQGRSAVAPRKSNLELLDIIHGRNSKKPNSAKHADRVIAAFSALSQRNAAGQVKPFDFNEARRALFVKGQSDPRFVARYDQIKGVGSFAREVLGQVPPTVIIPQPPRTLG